MSVKQQTGKTPKGLREPRVPDEAQYLWQWFWDLHRDRSYDDYSGAAKPITYAEMLAWSELTGSRPLAWEIAALRAIDRAVTTEIRIQARRRNR